MRLQIIVLFLISSNGVIFSQTTNVGNVWIRESYVNSIGLINDTLKEIDYLAPIVGFSGVFTKSIGIMGYHCDEISSRPENIKMNGIKTVVIKNVDGWLGYYLNNKGISDTIDFVGYLTMKNDKLLLQIWGGKKFIDEFYYVNHYKDYHFENLRTSYKYLYNLKHSKNKTN